MARGLGSTGWLAGVLVDHRPAHCRGRLSYGELAAMLPSAGGQYVYLREAWSPLWGFLYGWTLVSGDPDRNRRGRRRGVRALPGHVVAAHLREQLPDPADRDLTSTYAISLSTAQLVGILLILLLSWSNARGIQYGKIVQNIFTCTKIGSLLGRDRGRNFRGLERCAVKANFTDMWTPKATPPAQE